MILPHHTMFKTTVCPERIWLKMLQAERHPQQVCIWLSCSLLLPVRQTPIPAAPSPTWSSGEWEGVGPGGSGRRAAFVGCVILWEGDHVIVE